MYVACGKSQTILQRMAVLLDMTQFSVSLPVCTPASKRGECLITDAVLFSKKWRIHDAGFSYPRKRITPSLLCLSGKFSSSHLVHFLLNLVLDHFIFLLGTKSGVIIISSSWLLLMCEGKFLLNMLDSSGVCGLTIWVGMSPACPLDELLAARPGYLGDTDMTAEMWTYI